jgi:hypothetical protein
LGASMDGFYLTSMDRSVHTINIASSTNSIPST